MLIIHALTGSLKGGANMSLILPGYFIVLNVYRLGMATNGGIRLMVGMICLKVGQHLAQQHQHQHQH